MSNLANYSPYNKTYKFLLFQNQAYHEKNKRQMKPCVRTNLRYKRPSTSCNVNPEQSSFMIDLLNNSELRDSNKYSSPQSGMAKSMRVPKNQFKLSKIQFDKPKRVIHKNESFTKFQQKRIRGENKSLVKRLVNTSCEVIRNHKSSNSFRKHLKYREIRNKFDEQGNRKQALAVGQTDLLCPTLKDFNESQTGSKFIGMDMSWCSSSRSPSPQSSIRKRASYISEK